MLQHNISAVFLRGRSFKLSKLLVKLTPFWRNRTSACPPWAEYLTGTWYVTRSAFHHLKRTFPLNKWAKNSLLDLVASTKPLQRTKCKYLKGALSGLEIELEMVSRVLKVQIPFFPLPLPGLPSYVRNPKPSNVRITLMRCKTWYPRCQHPSSAAAC